MMMMMMSNWAVFDPQYYYNRVCPEAQKTQSPRDWLMPLRRGESDSLRQCKVSRDERAPE